ncbi:hypothetical protein GCM10027416_01920 [Okibacterium endophyticum]
MTPPVDAAGVDAAGVDAAWVDADALEATDGGDEDAAGAASVSGDEEPAPATRGRPRRGDRAPVLATAAAPVTSASMLISGAVFASAVSTSGSGSEGGC